MEREIENPEPQIKEYHKLACILLKWCHPSNFTNVRLTSTYLFKHVLTAIFALAYVIFLLTWYVLFLHIDEESTSSLYRYFNLIAILQLSMSYYKSGGMVQTSLWNTFSETMTQK